MKNDGKTITELSDELLAKVTGGTTSDTEISEEDIEKVKQVLYGLQQYACTRTHGKWNAEKHCCE